VPEKDFYQVSLKAILRNSHGEVLLLGGIPNETYTGYFDLPGGRIDINEFNTPFKDILKREIFEELSIRDVEISNEPVAIGRHEIEPKYSKTHTAIRVLYIFFEAKLLSGEPVLSREHSSIRWVNLSKINTAELFKSGIRQGIEMYLSRIKH
jgi:8-oxo-dGTP diphosphatase